MELYGVRLVFGISR